MKKSVAAISPVVPGRYFAFVERLVREQYQTLMIDADSEESARTAALESFFAGSLAYMRCTQIEPPVARVRPMREKNLRRVDPTDRKGDDTLRTSERFVGDDGQTLEPIGHFPGTRPAPVSPAHARLLCHNFDASGHSNHSGQGTTLWVILEHCASADIPYNLHAMPGVGYYVERAKAADDGLALRMPVETEHGALAPGDC